MINPSNLNLSTLPIVAALQQAIAAHGATVEIRGGAAG